ncbi:MAG: hypothetical protein HYT06_01810 [Candidatus Levybacteria bacterium]|nr:hypothetical protein [Candidatus Levybacteria bacterium]
MLKKHLRNESSIITLRILLKVKGGENVSQKTYNQITSIIFFIVAAGHVLRVISGWSVNISGWQVPMGVSIVAPIVGFYLFWVAFKLGR